VILKLVRTKEEVGINNLFMCYLLKNDAIYEE